MVDTNVRLKIDFPEIAKYEIYDKSLDSKNAGVHARQEGCTSSLILEHNVYRKL